MASAEWVSGIKDGYLTKTVHVGHCTVRIHSPILNDQERVRREEQVIDFKERIKPMVLNVARSKAITKVAGSKFIEDWQGVQIVLYIDDNVSAFGEIVSAVRVRDRKPIVRTAVKCADCGYPMEIENRPDLQVMSPANNPSAPMMQKIGAEQLQDFTKILEEYKAGKVQTEQRILASENWWKLRNSTEEQKDSKAAAGEGFKAVSGWLHNVIVSKHADAMKAFTKAVSKLLNSILQSSSFVAAGCIYKNAQLLNLVPGGEINSTDTYSTHIRTPSVSLLKQAKTGTCDFGRKLGAKRKLALELGSQQIVTTNRHLHTVGAKVVDSKPVPNILGKFQQHSMDFLLVFQVCGTSDAVTNGFDRAYKVLMHNTGVICTVGISPQLQSIYTKPLL